MAKRKYDNCFLKPEITQAGQYQIFKMKGKDSRGYPWMVRLAPITAKTYPAEMPQTANADRIELYVGGKPAEIDKISGKMEVALGEEAEKYNIEKAAMVYVPKGVPVQHRIIKYPKETTWLLNLTLTPKYEPPKVKKGGK
ncbi:MAG: hypothetical protein PHG35_04655 [Dehalococcoidales bacterium]|nr:hypothetical protein [Dehalococcoidales bacterium]